MINKFLIALTIIVFQINLLAQDVYNFYWQKNPDKNNVVQSKNGQTVHDQTTQDTNNPNNIANGQNSSIATQSGNTIIGISNPAKTQFNVAEEVASLKYKNKWKMRFGFGVVPVYEVTEVVNFLDKGTGTTDKEVIYSTIQDSLIIGGDYQFNKYFSARGELIGKYGINLGVKARPFSLNVFDYDTIGYSLIGGITMPILYEDSINLKSGFYGGASIDINLTESLALELSVVTSAEVNDEALGALSMLTLNWML